MICQWFLKLLVRMGVKFKPMIFCYHTITREVLCRQVQLLTSVFGTRRLDQINEPARNVIAFTLDDCRKRDVELWDEVISRFEIPATLFIPVKHHRNQSALWTDQLTRLFQEVDEFNFRGVTYDVSTKETRASSFAAISACIYESDLNTEEVEDYLGEVLRQRGIDVALEYRVVGPERLKELLANSHFSVGSHSMTHAFLCKLSAAEVETEMADSKSYLTNHYPTRFSPCFCYPYGSHRLIGETAKAFVRRHYAMAVIMDGKAVEGDPYLMGRIALYNKDTSLRLVLKVLKAQWS